MQDLRIKFEKSNTKVRNLIMKSRIDSVHWT